MLYAFSPLGYALEHGVEGAAKEALTAYGRDKVSRAHTNQRAVREHYSAGGMSRIATRLAAKHASATRKV